MDLFWREDQTLIEAVATPKNQVGKMSVKAARLLIAVIDFRKLFIDRLGRVILNRIFGPNYI
jgi:hypothetical protein